MRKIVIAAMILGCFLTACGIPDGSAAGEPEEEASGREMLLDSFRRTVGTPMEMPYYELVIYTYDSEHLLLEEYADGGTDHETVKGYLIPHDAYASVLEIIRKHRMQVLKQKRAPKRDKAAILALSLGLKNYATLWSFYEKHFAGEDWSA